MARLTLHGFLIIALTLLTQVGGLAWLIACLFRHRLAAFAALYAAFSIATVHVAPLTGRVALSCFDTGPLQVQSWTYCALNRVYVTPELRDLLHDTAAQMDQQFPGTQTLVLDAGFPCFTGFPLIPHLSHDDGEKVDLALDYRDATGYLPGATRSPLGYFAFEQGPTDCPPAWPTLRWDLDALQPLWRDLALDLDRTAALLRILADDPRIGRVLVEPHLVQTLNATHPNIRFQGCRAARHDDHIHLQLG